VRGSTDAHSDDGADIGADNIVTNGANVRANIASISDSRVDPTLGK
jgi:hypothetical protein